MRYGIVLTAVAVGSLVAGCGGGGTKQKTAHSSSPSASPAAATLTEAQARAVFASYEKVNNEANSKVSDALLRQNETGPMLEVDLAGNKRIRAKQESKIKPFYYKSPQFFIPHGVSPAWFAVLAPVTTGDKEYVVFADTGGGKYKAAMGAWLAKGQQFPSIARGADGSVTAVTTGPALDVGTRLSSYLSYVAARQKAPEGFAPGPLTSKLGQRWAKDVYKINSGNRWRGRSEWAPRTQPVYALKTTDGGALVLSPSVQALVYTAIQPNVWYKPPTDFYGLGPKRYYHRFRGEWLWTFATHVPPQGQASVVASGVHAISATGS
ncbi:lipoprotein [Actinoallomurus vinaceus]|uniref:Lipoprotein n=1 Tax=Actinoallomurus vinaceus TaxID=1080074 RepID=A0ABP8U5P7_9ACTN